MRADIEGPFGDVARADAVGQVRIIFILSGEQEKVSALTPTH